MLLRRTLTLTAREARPDAVFRIARAAEIKPAGEGTYVVGKSLRITVRGSHAAEVVTVENEKQLQIPLDIPAGKSSLVLEYHW